MRIAIFGGTFDPIHNAHLAVAEAAAKQFALDKVLLVPAANPPHKANQARAPYEDRYAMVERACRDRPRLEPSRLEAGAERSYSLYTIERLRASIDPGDRIFFLIGADAFSEVTTWHRWEQVIHAVEFIVVSRPGHDFAVPQGAVVHRLETLSLPVSSSAIRRKLGAGKEPEEVPSAVLDYIREHGLYGLSTINS